jgi:hypothetical protein
MRLSRALRALATPPKNGGAITKEKIMAKKSKRQVSRRSTRISAASGGEFNPDYTAVKKDLKTIGSLAGFFVLVLVVLSFFLR